MVLLAVSTVVGVGYVLIATATSTSSMSNNSSMSVEARNTSRSGAAIAYQKMVDAAWGGVDTNYTQSLGDGISYTATYTSGDASLPASDPDQPYLVTITVVATVDNPLEGTADTQHTTKLVVRLVPKTPDSQPTDWSTFLNYTVYQTHEFDSKVQFPCRVEGNCRFQRKLAFFDKYPGNDDDWGGNDVLFVVVNPSSLTSQESLRSAYLTSEGFDVTLIDESASQSSYDAAVAINDVVYVSEEVLSGNLNTKASNLTIGLVNEEPGLYDDTGTSSSGSTASKRRWVEMFDTSHWITDGYSQGSWRKVSQAKQTVTRITGTKSPDLRILCRSVKIGQSTYDSLGVLESTDRTWNSGYTTSRRVQLPWGGGDFDFSKLDADGEILLWRSITWAATDNARRRLFRDLNVQHLLGGSDKRPFNGEISLPFSQQDDDTTTEMTEWLGLTVHDVAASDPAGDWVMPTNFMPTTYKLYDKGKTYTATALTTNTLSNETLAADPDTNPLGLFTYNNDLTIGSNVTITGSLICERKVTITGTNVVLNPVDMYSTDSSSYLAMRTPTILCGDSLEVGDGASATASGLIVTFKHFLVNAGAQTTAFALDGQVVCEEKFVVEKRTEWDGYNFRDGIKAFMNQATHNRFPDYLDSVNIDPVPLIKITQPVDSYEYHWIDPNSPDPLYLPSGGSGEFEFELVRMEN